MISEALKYLADLGAKAATPIPVENDDPASNVFAINGKLETLAKPFPERDHAAGSLADLIELANRFAADEASSPVVWFDRDSVILVIDDAKRRIDHVGMALVESELFERVLALKGEWQEQKAFVRLLRVELAGTLPPVALLEKVRRVRFDNGQTVTSEVKRDRESMGREITAKIEADGGDLPEEVTLMVPVYRNPGERDAYPIRCAVEIDHARGAFRLTPLPDQIECAYQAALASIRARLASGLAKNVPAYLGTA